MTKGKIISLGNINTILARNEGHNPPIEDQIVFGYDELLKKWTTVQYRYDSNRYFDYPYTGAVYPLYRMNRWRSKN